MPGIHDGGKAYSQRALSVKLAELGLPESYLRRPWTKEEEAKLLETEGVSRELCVEMLRTPAQIGWRRRKAQKIAAGEYPPKREPLSSKFPTVVASPLSSEESEELSARASCIGMSDVYDKVASHRAPTKPEARAAYRDTKGLAVRVCLNCPVVHICEKLAKGISGTGFFAGGHWVSGKRVKEAG